MIKIHTDQFSPLKHLSCLSKIYPVEGAVIIGAGMGQGPWFDLLQQIETNVLLIEAEGDKLQHLEHRFLENAGWDIQQQIISGKQGENTFYTVANSAESSLLAPDELRDLWPQIKLKQQRDCQTITLDGLCQQIDFTINWLILDCLPALPLLQGAQQMLSGMDIVVVRMITDNQLCKKIQASFQEIEVFMMEQDFQCIGLEQEFYPALGHGVYLRDYAGLLQQQADQAVEQERKFNVLNHEFSATQQLAKKQNRQLQDQQVRHDAVYMQLENCRAELEQRINELDIKSCEMKEQKEKAQHWNLEQERLSTQVKQLKDETARLNQTISLNNKKLIQLQKQAAEKDQKLHLSHDEIIKAEGQIDLIKDLLLRNEGI